MVELVPQLVDRLLELEHLEQPVAPLARRRDDAPVDVLEVPVEELLTSALNANVAISLDQTAGTRAAAYATATATRSMGRPSRPYG